MSDIETIMRAAPVIPVLVIEDAELAGPIAEALVDGGLKVLEVTLRTDAAIEAIGAMRKVEGAIVGAGTVTDPASLDRACDAGAQFIVSPGLTEPLGRAALDRKMPFLPGVATAGDIMRGLDMGLEHFKFFPAEAAGGIDALKALSGPFAKPRFCPTGGVRQDTAAAWLALEQVLCVGGSWLVPRGTPDVAAIRDRAQSAAALASSR